MWFSSSAGVSTSLSSMKSTSSACSTSASTKCPMRTLAITGIVTVAMISRITLIDAMRATPPSLRMSEGTRSSAITAQAPAFSAIFACSALVTSMMTPPFSISARPTFTRHSFEPLLPLPLPFTFFASISLLLSSLEFPGGCCSAKSIHRGASTTKRARPLARTSPAALRISPDINKFLPRCSVSHPSTTISFSTLTGFRYSTVSSAVTARASRNRQTFPMASSSSVAIIPPCPMPPPPWYRSPKTNRPAMRRFSLSCTKVSFIPSSLAPPHPKQRFEGFGAIVIVAGFVSSALSVLFTLRPLCSIFFLLCASNQRYSAAHCTPHATLPLAHLHPQQFRQGRHPARNLLFIQTGKRQAHRIRKGILRVQVPPRHEQHSPLFRMNQQLAGIKSERQFQPQTHAAFRTSPARLFRYVFAERLIQRHKPRS